ncbi:PAS domain-containing protein [Sphingomonas sp. PP-CE-3G-477]|nr:PAS domain-containing protein [Sphingomonas sp. PP-CE-3G-477]
MIIGHSISNGDGVIQVVDETVATLLQRTQKQLVGLSYLAITHPDDLARNRSQVIALQPNGNSAKIRKRYIGGEGDILTLEVQVSRLGSGQTGHLVGTLSTIPTAVDVIDPADMPYRLWQRAKSLLGVMRARDETLGSDLFADHAWTTLLIVYVAEAEGRIASIDMVAGALGMSRATLGRWIRVLQTRSLIEPPHADLDALQLTQTGIDGIERLLATQPAMEVS